MQSVRSLARKMRVTVLLLVVVAILAACGVPADTHPRSIPVNQVPFDLLAPSTSNPPTSLPVTTVGATIYLIGPQRLVTAKRSVAEPLSLGGVLAALVQGPTSAEETSGLRSAISPQTAVLSAEIQNGVAIVNLSDSFAGIGPQEQVNALAQVVFTATEIPGVTGVRVELNSEPAQVLRGDGSSTKDVLHRNDYAGLAP